MSHFRNHTFQNGRGKKFSHFILRNMELIRIDLFEKLEVALYRSDDTPVEEVSVIVAYQSIEDNQSYQFMQNLILLLEKQTCNGILNHLQCEQVSCHFLFVHLLHITCRFIQIASQDVCAVDQFFLRWMKEITAEKSQLTTNHGNL